MSKYARTLAAILFCAGLVGCEAVPNQTTSATGDAAPEFAAIPKQAAPPPAPKIDTPEPVDMIGWDDAKIAAVLGSASLVRRDLSSEIWQYQTADCVLFLFLYPDRGVSRIKHVESRNADNGDVKACITSVLRERLSAAQQPSPPKT